MGRYPVLLKKGHILPSWKMYPYTVNLSLNKQHLYFLWPLCNLSFYWIQDNRNMKMSKCFYNLLTFWVKWWCVSDYRTSQETFKRPLTQCIDVSYTLSLLVIRLKKDFNIKRLEKNSLCRKSRKITATQKTWNCFKYLRDFYIAF